MLRRLLQSFMLRPLAAMLRRLLQSLCCGACCSPVSCCWCHTPRVTRGAGMLVVSINAQDTIARPDTCTNSSTVTHGAEAREEFVKKCVACLVLVSRIHRSCYRDILVEGRASVTFTHLPTPTPSASPFPPTHTPMCVCVCICTHDLSKGRTRPDVIIRFRHVRHQK
jgi:hypothetical protein